MRRETTTCCIAGGGPAGMMAGLLLARQGIEVMVLEKHADFLRDFRGDTIHPATLQLLAELGMIEEFLQLPHTKMPRIIMETPTGPTTFADFTRWTGPYGYIAFVPQWDFLNFIARKAEAYPSFRLITRAEVTGLIEENGQNVGVHASTPEGPLEVHAKLVVGADGRHSAVRKNAGLESIACTPLMDVLWLRLRRNPDEQLPFFRNRNGRFLVSINRGDYWQLSYLIPLQGFEAVKQVGLPAFQASIAACVPALADRVGELASWDDVKLLSVRVDRLRQWYRPGLLCIGDAAHAMSPAGGVGINLAIQDAVAMANILGPTFRSGGPMLSALRRVQRRRELPTRLVQAFQLRALGSLYPKASASSAGDSGTSIPLAFRLMRYVPALRHAFGWFIGRGIRPEHIPPRPG